MKIPAIPRLMITRESSNVPHTQILTDSIGSVVRRIPALEACGRYLLRCVHPFIVPDTLLVVAREKVCPGSCYKYKYL